MSNLIIKLGCPWVHVPATDCIRPYWINLATVKKVTSTQTPVSCTMFFVDKTQQTLNGLQAIAVIDAIAEITGEGRHDDE